MRYILVSWLLVSLSSFAYAMTEEEAKIVRESVLEICRGGSLKGKDSSVQIKGEGKVTTVLFKKLAEAGLSGKAEFSKAEWDGIRPLLPERFDANAYVKCVTELTPKFLDKFLPQANGVIGSEKSKTIDEVREIVAAQFNVFPGQIDITKPLSQSVSIDDLDVVEIVLTLEEKFDVPIQDYRIEKLKKTHYQVLRGRYTYKGLTVEYLDKLLLEALKKK